MVDRQPGCSQQFSTRVFWPSLQRDFLLSMAVEGLYRPLWSEVILDELEFHEAAKLERRGHSAAAARAAGGSTPWMDGGWVDPVRAARELLQSSGFRDPSVRCHRLLERSVLENAGFGTNRWTPLLPASSVVAKPSGVTCSTWRTRRHVGNVWRSPA